jgi:hypothetical protein
LYTAAMITISNRDLAASHNEHIWSHTRPPDRQANKVDHLIFFSSTRSVVAQETEQTLVCAATLL